MAGVTPLRIVSPYRPFQPESHAHQLLGPFDWIEALRLLAKSAQRAQGYETVAITDVDTALPVPALQFVTTHRRLMLWILEVCLCYLSSNFFDCDTVMLSPDTLVTGDLRPYFAGDLTILVRTTPKHKNRPVLNAAQWWPVSAREKLIAFYRRAIDIAVTLPEGLIVWGADTVPIARLISPLELGLHARAGLRVSMVEARRVLGRPVLPPVTPIVDFKYLSKPEQAPYFERWRRFVLSRVS